MNMTNGTAEEEDANDNDNDDNNSSGVLQGHRRQYYTDSDDGNNNNNDDDDDDPDESNADTDDSDGNNSGTVDFSLTLSRTHSVASSHCHTSQHKHLRPNVIYIQQRLTFSFLLFVSFRFPDDPSRVELEVLWHTPNLQRSIKLKIVPEETTIGAIKAKIARRVHVPEQRQYLSVCCCLLHAFVCVVYVRVWCCVCCLLLFSWFILHNRPCAPFSFFSKSLTVPKH